MDAKMVEDSNVGPVPRFSRLGTLSLLFCSLAIVALAFDYRTIEGEGGSLLQIAALGLSVLGFLGFVSIESLGRMRQRRAVRALPGSLALWVLFVGWASVVAIAGGVPEERYVRVATPYMLFGMGMALAYVFLGRGGNPKTLLRIVLVGAFAGTIWRVLYGYGIAGLEVEEARWRILSPGVPLLLGYGISGLMLSKRRMLPALSLGLATIVIVLSVTRSYLISAALVVIACYWLKLRLSGGRGGLFGTHARLVFIGLAVAVVLPVVFEIRPDIGLEIANRFVGHSVEGGLDYTAITRLAEWNGQIGMVLRSPVRAAIGYGMGESYELDKEFLAQLPFAHGADDVWHAGHSTWVYSFFCAGLAAGLLPLYVVASSVRRSYRQLASSSSVPWRLVEPHAQWFALLLAVIGLSFTANIFVERYAGLLFGLVVGVASMQLATPPTARGDR